MNRRDALPSSSSIWQQKNSTSNVWEKAKTMKESTSAPLKPLLEYKIDIPPPPARSNLIRIPLPPPRQQNQETPPVQSNKEISRPLTGKTNVFSERIYPIAIPKPLPKVPKQHEEVPAPVLTAPKPLVRIPLPPPRDKKKVEKFTQRPIIQEPELIQKHGDKKSESMIENPRQSSMMDTCQRLLDDLAQSMSEAKHQEPKRPITQPLWQPVTLESHLPQPVVGQYSAWPPDDRHLNYNNHQSEADRYGWYTQPSATPQVPVKSNQLNMQAESKSNYDAVESHSLSQNTAHPVQTSSQEQEISVIDLTAEPVASDIVKNRISSQAVGENDQTVPGLTDNFSEEQTNASSGPVPWHLKKKLEWQQTNENAKKRKIDPNITEPVSLPNGLEKAKIFKEKNVPEKAGKELNDGTPTDEANKEKMLQEGVTRALPGLQKESKIEPKNFDYEKANKPIPLNKLKPAIQNVHPIMTNENDATKTFAPENSSQEMTKIPENQLFDNYVIFPNTIVIFNGSNNFLSMIFPSTFSVEGRYYYSIEHFYQATKIRELLGDEHVYAIQSFTDSSSIRKTTHRLLQTYRVSKKACDEWKRLHSALVLYTGAWNKFKQNPTTFGYGKEIVGECLRGR